MTGHEVLAAVQSVMPHANVKIVLADRHTHTSQALAAVIDNQGSSQLTYDLLARLVNVLGTTHIDVIGAIEGGYYPGEDEPRLELKVRW